MTSVVKRFIVLGDTGAGKSSFINAFYNYCYGTHDPESVFDGSQNNVQIAIPCKYWEDRRAKILGEEKSTERNIEDETKSQTMCCTTHTLEFRERDTDPHTFVIELIDTPGFNDTEGVSKDDSNVYHIEKAVQNVDYLNGIIIVVNGSTSRLGTSFQHFMQLLHEVWPNDLMKNVCAVLTNCDDTTCNLKSEVLQDLLKVNRKTVVYMQNSLFRWDRKTRTNKIIRNLRRDFVETVESLKNLEWILVRFEKVSTNAFVVGAIKQNYIQQCIHDTINNIIQMLQIDRQTCVVEEGLGRARATMSANKKWEKEASITVTKWMKVEQPQSFYSPYQANHFQPRSYSYPGQFRSDSSHFDDNQCQSFRRSPTLTNCLTTCFSSGSSSFDRLKKTEVGTSSTYNTYEKNSFRLPNGCSPQQPNNEQQSRGHGANHYGHRKNQHGHEENHYGDRKKQYGHGVNQYGYGANQYGYGANQYGYGANQYGYGANQYGLFSYIDDVFRPATTYRAEEREIKVTLEDNEAKSNHETARQEVKDLRAKKNEFGEEYALTVTSHLSLLDTLLENVREMREINMGVDLLEKNKELLLKFRNEIALGGDDAEIIKIYEKVVLILTKPIELRSNSS